MIAWLSQAWPWYVAGPLIGLFVPALLVLGNKQLGISNNLRHLCAALVPRSAAFFRYEWKEAGLWNLAFLAGIILGGFIGGKALAGPAVAIASRTHADLAALGIHDFSGLAPHELFSWSRLLTLRGLGLIAGGGFLVGFGTAYAGGCTSGHGIAGLANLEVPSLIAVVGFFAGGLLATYILLPHLL
jgi:uncharacterized membrane protein YedE/YeeE